MNLQACADAFLQAFPDEIEINITMIDRGRPVGHDTKVRFREPMPRTMMIALAWQRGEAVRWDGEHWRTIHGEKI